MTKRRPPAQSQVGGAHVRRDHIARVFFARLVLLVDAERARQIRIELTQWYRCLADIALLRCLAEAARDRGARLMGPRKIGAAIERVVGRRLQTGL